MLTMYCILRILCFADNLSQKFSEKMLTINSLFIYTTTVVFSVVIIAVLYLKKAYEYWNKLNVPTFPPLPLFGHFKHCILQKMSMGQEVEKLYKKLNKSGKPFYGLYFFWEPVLLILDPEHCKLIMTKKFHYFDSRIINVERIIENEPLIGNLLNISGEKWKFLRYSLSPTFTPGKIKQMLNTLLEHAVKLEDVIGEYTKNNQPFEVKETLGRFTTDIIGSCAFGIECNSLKDPNNFIRKFIQEAAESSTTDTIKMLLVRFIPELYFALGIKSSSKETEDLFVNIFKNIIQCRKVNKRNRKDLFNLLLKSTGYSDGENLQTKVVVIHLISEFFTAEETFPENDQLFLEQIVAQSVLFFIVGFEIPATVLSSVMYELSVHQNIQEKLRDEIVDVLNKYNEKITYENLTEMPYLEKVINGNTLPTIFLFSINIYSFFSEAMRLHAPVPVVSRKCTKDYIFPGSNLIIHSGTNVLISINGFHKDAEYFPNPEVFDPERFSSQEKAKRHPYVFLPFGAGPRNCIGKICVSLLLSIS